LVSRRREGGKGEGEKVGINTSVAPHGTLVARKEKFERQVTWSARRLTLTTQLDVEVRKEERERGGDDRTPAFSPNTGGKTKVWRRGDMSGWKGGKGRKRESSNRAIALSRRKEKRGRPNACSGKGGEAFAHSLFAGRKAHGTHNLGERRRRGKGGPQFCPCSNHVRVQRGGKNGSLRPYFYRNFDWSCAGGGEEGKKTSDRRVSSSSVELGKSAIA